MGGEIVAPYILNTNDIVVLVTLVRNVYAFQIPCDGVKTHRWGVLVVVVVGGWKVANLSLNLLGSESGGHRKRG